MNKKIKEKILEILFNNARHDDLNGIVIVSRINDNVFRKIVDEIDAIITSAVEETIEKMDDILWDFDITGESAWEFQNIIGAKFAQYMKATRNK